MLALPMRIFRGWANTRQPFSAVSGPNFTKFRMHIEESLQIDKFLSDCWHHVPLQRYVQSEFKVSPKSGVYLPPSLWVWGELMPREFGPNFSNISHKWICPSLIEIVQWPQRLGVEKKEEETRKRSQSYWHSDPRWQQQHTAIATCITCNHVIVTFFVTVWLWPFDLWVNACQATTIEYMCTKFGLLIAQAIFHLEPRQTDRQMRLNSLPMPAAIQPAWIQTTTVKYKHFGIAMPCGLIKVNRKFVKKNVIQTQHLHSLTVNDRTQHN